jgi:deoxyadenosine/deoxycytidine kinase
MEVDRFMLVLLEGNIAAGKTTLGAQLAASAFFEFVPEPVERWQGGFAANLLERFYTDTRRWSFTLQICAFVTRTQALQAHAANRNDPERVRVFERSIYCDRHVFAKNLHQHGFMDDTEWALYLHLAPYAGERRLPGCGAGRSPGVGRRRGAGKACTGHTPITKE